MTQQRTTESILNDAEDTLYTAQLGFRLVQGQDPRKRMAGFRDLVVFGRAVTNVLQNLRHTEGNAFEEWYQPKVKEMENDRVLKCLYELRSQILKEGMIRTTIDMTFTGSPGTLMQQYQPPPGAKGFFMGDNIGGCGWEIELEPGVTEKFYIDVPDNLPGLQLTIDVHLLDSPEELKGKTIKELSEYYISYLSALVKEAKSVFLAKRNN